MLKRKRQLFSLCVVVNVLSPAKYFVVGILSSPEKPSIFSTTVVMFLWDFRNWCALNFLISQGVWRRNFRIAMLPTRS